MKKKKAWEIEEELEATGQESETGAVKWVKEKGKETRHEETEESVVDEWKLHDKRKQLFTYKDVLLTCFKRQMMESYDFLPKNFLWYPVPSDKGLVLWFRDSRGKWYAHGMHISLVPKYDLNCITRLIHKALDKMDELERAYQEEEQVQKGIILP